MVKKYMNNYLVSIFISYYFGPARGGGGHTKHSYMLCLNKPFLPDSITNLNIIFCFLGGAHNQTIVHRNLSKFIESMVEINSQHGSTHGQT